MKKLLLLSLSLLYGYGVAYSPLAVYFPRLFVYFLLFINGLAFVFYGMDKLSALRGWRRTPEKHFYILALLGAWPGSVLGQFTFRHKTTKQSFRRWFYAMIILHLAGLSTYLYFA